MYDVAICDDDVRDSEYLKQHIMRNKKYGELLRFHAYRSGKELLDAMKLIRFSIIFLDIEMEGMDGEDTAEEIRKQDNSVVLVFCTGRVEPSLRSFEVQPYRFMKKNMTNAELDGYIMASLERMAELADMPWLEAKRKGEKLYLRPGDIVYIEKYKKNTRVYLSEQAKIRYGIKTTSEEIRIADKLENLYEQLKSFGFGYPHNSYIINFDFMLSCKDHEFRLEGIQNTIFKISRSRATEFKILQRAFLMKKYEGWGRK